MSGKPKSKKCRSREKSTESKKSSEKSSKKSSKEKDKSSKKSKSPKSKKEESRIIKEGDLEEKKPELGNLLNQNPENKISGTLNTIQNIMTKEEILNKLLNGELSNYITFKSETRGDKIYIHELEMSIKPIVFQARANSVSLGFDMYSNVLKTHFYEYSAGLAQDSETALGMAIANFVFAFMQGLKEVADNNVKCRVKSEFGGHSHSWSVYTSNLLFSGVGNSEENHQHSEYWELLKEDITLRLGNQKVVYVKIFNSNNNSKVISECRINDVNIPELGEKVAEIAKKWSPAGYKSEKQFFFIVQDDNTMVDFPYKGEEGQKKVKSAVAEYLKKFSEINSEKEYDNLIEIMTTFTGDKMLAEEITHFIPEICAEKYFEDTLAFNDEILIEYPGGKTITSYKSQISNYIPMMNAVFDTFNSGILGEKTNHTFSRLVQLSQLSSMYNLYTSTMEKSSNEKNEVKDVFMLLVVPKDFEIR